MSFSILAILIVFHAATTTIAAERAQIRAARVNVRAAPSMKSKILTKLDRGKIVEKLGQKGKWTRVRMDAPLPPAWIYSSLLSPLPSPFARFQAYYRRLNRSHRSTAGDGPFSGVLDAGNGVAYIKTSPVWDTLSAEEQAAHIESLYGAWKTANDGDPVALHLYDGRMHRLRSDLTTVRD